MEGCTFSPRRQASVLKQGGVPSCPSRIEKLFPSSVCMGLSVLPPGTAPPELHWPPLRCPDPALLGLGPRPWKNLMWCQLAEREPEAHSPGRAS